jgi:hypothetical protein
MNHNYGPPPPRTDTQGNQDAPYPPQRNPTQPNPIQPDPTQPDPTGPQRTNKTLIIVLSGVAAMAILALIAVFVWVIPAFSKQHAEEEPAPAVTSARAAEGDAVPEGTAAPSEGASSADMPAGAIALPPGWNERQGPANIPAEGDGMFSRFATGESSFQYLASWTSDETFGITTDPSTGAPMQQKAQGTEDRDGDGIALAYAFFAEAEEGKFGKEPAKVQAAIRDIETKFTSLPAADLPQHLVGHKCTSNFETTTPEIREFRRSAAVAVGFPCVNARGETIQAVNLFTVTPWGTPQMVGVSGHQSYWNANPGLMEKIANSYGANRWKLAG